MTQSILTRAQSTHYFPTAKAHLRPFFFFFFGRYSNQIIRNEQVNAKQRANFCSRPLKGKMGFTRRKASNLRGADR